MPKKTLSATGTSADGIERPLSKGQKAFNALIKKIENRRASLAAWEAYSPEFQRKFNGEVLPLRTRFDEVRVEFVQRLDEQFSAKGRTKVEQETISRMIVHVTSDLLHTFDDPAIRELHRRHSPPAPMHAQFADAESIEDEQEALIALQKKIAAQYGVDLGDDVELMSPKALFDRVHEQIVQQAADERKRDEARQDYHAKRKAAKQAEAEEKARAEEAEVHLSIREVYRKLASLLHPDRETDPVERERKAALMQRVNVAYGSRSLLDLLEIQLEVEHIDQAALNDISEDRLRRWNTILEGQLYDLGQELAEIEYGYMARAYMNQVQRITPMTTKRALTSHVISIRSFIQSYEDDLHRFDDQRIFKPWLKHLKRLLDDR